MFNFINKLTRTSEKIDQKTIPEIKQYSKNDSIDELPFLSSRVLNTLERNNIYTIGDLEDFGKDALYVLRQIGRVAIQEIEKAYENYTGKKLPLTRKIEPGIKNVIKKESFNQDRNIIEEKKELVTITSKNYGGYNWLGKDKFLKTNIGKDIFLDQLGLTQQVINALAKVKIYTVGDISLIPTNKLWERKGIGKRSIINISEELINPSNPLIGTDLSKKDLVTLLLFRLKDSREKDIIIRRYGLKTGERQTLEEIGHNYNLTRERIRQVEKRAIKKLRHPSNVAKNIIKNNIENIILKEGGIISDEEADRLLISTIGSNNFDGSSLLDLIADLGGINRAKIGDVSLYCPLYIDFNFSDFIYKIYSIFKKADSTLTIKQIKQLVNLGPYLFINNQNINTDRFIERCCKIHPHIQERKYNEYSTYIKNHCSTKIWISMMRDILEKENIPLHFTEITHKVNEQYMNDKPLDVRRAHSLLIESPIFAHIGVRGTYGLVKWGIRKESSITLVEECINKAGFPLHWTQILNYVGKYKNTSKANVKAILDNSGKFYHIGDGVYAIKKL